MHEWQYYYKIKEFNVRRVIYFQNEKVYLTHICVSIYLLQQKNLPVNNLYTIIKCQNTQNKSVSMSLIKCFSTLVLLLTCSFNSQYCILRLICMTPNPTHLFYWATTQCTLGPTETATRSTPICFCTDRTLVKPRFHACSAM